MRFVLSWSLYWVGGRGRGGSGEGKDRQQTQDELGSEQSVRTFWFWLSSSPMVLQFRVISMLPEPSSGPGTKRMTVTDDWVKLDSSFILPCNCWPCPSFPCSLSPPSFGNSRSPHLFWTPEGVCCFVSLLFCSSGFRSVLLTTADAEALLFHSCKIYSFNNFMQCTDHDWVLD